MHVRNLPCINLNTVYSIGTKTNVNKHGGEIREINKVGIVEEKYVSGR